MSGMPVIGGNSPGGGGGGGGEPSVCAGCGAKIVDRFYLLAVDRQWHSHCLKCSECNLRLDSELTCFARDGNIYCKEDYYRLFAVKRCARCHLGISATELVMRARELVYHVHCFTCASCNKPLTKGDQFGMKDSMVYCRLHYELLGHHPANHHGGNTPHHNQEAALHEPFSPSPTRLPFYNGAGAVQKGRPRKRKIPEAVDPNNAALVGLTAAGMELLPGGSELCNLDQSSGYDTTPPPSSNTPHLQPTRTKRMRTSFKHHQLRTMKSYFALNQNPDAKDLKQLAQKTGLSKRVLQVWFQNARAKWRRNMMRQDSQNSDKPSGDPTGMGGEMGGGTHLSPDGMPTGPLSLGVGDLPPGHLPSDDQSSASLTFAEIY